MSWSNWDFVKEEGFDYRTVDEEELRKELEGRIGEEVRAISHLSTGWEIGTIGEGIRGPLLRYPEGTYSWYYRMAFLHLPKDDIFLLNRTLISDPMEVVLMLMSTITGRSNEDLFKIQKHITHSLPNTHGTRNSSSMIVNEQLYYEIGEKILDRILKEVEKMDSPDWAKAEIFILTGEGGIETLSKEVADSHDAHGIAMRVVTYIAHDPFRADITIAHCPQFDDSRSEEARYPKTYYPLTSFMYDVYVGGNRVLRLKPKI